MNKITLPTLLTLACCFFFGLQMKAQDGYTYTLAHNGGYDFSVQVVPNTSSNNFATSVQSYGFTIILPDGVTIDTGSATSLGSAESATLFDGSAVGQASIDGYLVTETLGSPASLPAPSAATNTNVYSFTVNGNPTSGELRILENNSALATTVTALKSFMQADMIDNGMAQFVNVVDPNAAAVSGMSSFNFATLSTPETSLDQLSVYPNPATDIVNISGVTNELNKVEVYNLNGQMVLSKDSDLTSVKIGHLQSGVYFMKLYADNAKKTIKLVRK